MIRTLSVIMLLAANLGLAPTFAGAATGSISCMARHMDAEIQERTGIALASAISSPDRVAPAILEEGFILAQAECASNEALAGSASIPITAVIKIINEFPCILDSCEYSICFLAAFAGFWEETGGALPTNEAFTKAHDQCSQHGNPCGAG